MKRLTILASLVSLALAVSGCAIIDELFAMQAADSVDLAENESALSTTALEGVDETTTPAEAAQISVDNLGIYLQPAGCAVGTIDLAEPNRVSWEIDDCTGPFGFVTIHGTVEVVYTAIPDGIRAEYSGTGVKFNQATMDLDASSELTFVGQTRHRSVTTHSKGFGARGHEIEREGTYELSWDIATHCLRLDGTWESRVDNKRWTTSVSDWERCEGECPKAGGQIQFVGGIRNVTVTLNYDGSDAVAWSSSRGSSGSLALNCVE
jgi:hypothetical protein